MFLAWKALSMAAWSGAIHRPGLQVEVRDPAPDNRLEISRAHELLKENAWSTRQSSWHWGGKPRPGPELQGLQPLRMAGPPSASDSQADALAPQGRRNPL